MYEEGNFEYVRFDRIVLEIVRKYHKYFYL